VVASELKNKIYVPSMGRKIPGEEGMERLYHLPYVQWNDWIVQLSKFKYAVHLMPTVAAGTFSLNCAYLYLPCIGNIEVDTQRICHPLLSIDINDIKQARKLAIRLKGDKDFYNDCSVICKENYKKYYSIDIWKQKMNLILNYA
jgi:hypothetical protein